MPYTGGVVKRRSRFGATGFRPAAVEERCSSVRGQHVVIVGCGRVGSGPARIIEGRDHTVAVVDKDLKAFRRLHGGVRRLAGPGVWPSVGAWKPRT